MSGYEHHPILSQNSLLSESISNSFKPRAEALNEFYLKMG